MKFAFAPLVFAALLFACGQPAEGDTHKHEDDTTHTEGDPHVHTEGDGHEHDAVHDTVQHHSHDDGHTH